MRVSLSRLALFLALTPVFGVAFSAALLGEARYRVFGSLRLSCYIEES